jgi:hypothetical protein
MLERMWWGKEPLYTVDENVNLLNHYGKQYRDSQKPKNQTTI